MSEKMTWDPHCYECKVRYRDPKAKDLVMYLHAWRYKVRITDLSKDHNFVFLSLYHRMTIRCEIRIAYDLSRDHLKIF